MFRTRSYQKELLDDINLEGAELDQNLRELHTINSLLGGYDVTLTGLSKIKQSLTKPATIIDIGCGGGDLLKIIQKWSNRKGLDFNLIGLDNNPYILNHAKENCKNLRNAEFVLGDVQSKGSVLPHSDVASLSLFCHHFTDDELISIFKNLKDSGISFIIINDLHRHFLAFGSIWFLTRIFPSSRLVKNDAPLSVKRGFRKIELENILKKSGLNNYKISWKWAFRWQIIISLKNE